MNETIKNLNWSDVIKVALQLGGVLVLVGNMWIASRLAPLANNDVVIIARVEALEKGASKNELSQTDIELIKAEVLHIKSDLSEMKVDIKDLLRLR